MNTRGRIYILARGNELQSIAVHPFKGSFKTHVYPFLLDGWHVVSFQRLDELKEKAPKVDLFISKYWERKRNETPSNRDR